MVERVVGCVFWEACLSPGLACDNSISKEMSSSDWMQIKGKCHGVSDAMLTLYQLTEGSVSYCPKDMTNDTAGRHLIT